MNISSQEQDKQAILDRMRARRENYRRMLQDEEQHGQVPVSSAGLRDTHAFHAVSRQQSMLQVLRQHPLLVLAGVGIVMAIGPKRVLRGLAGGGTALAALTANNQSNAGLLGRLLSVTGAYLQGRTAR